MKTPPAIHGSFSIERIYPAAPEKVFAAWGDIEAKANWFIGPDGWTLVHRSQDFRVGGHEVLRGRFEVGMETSYLATFFEIVPNRRIVYVYDMHLDDQHYSLSLATVEFEARGDETRMRFHEQIVFLNGTAAEEGTFAREVGVSRHFDLLADSLR